MIIEPTYVANLVLMDSVQKSFNDASRTSMDPVQKSFNDASRNSMDPVQKS